jgi:type IV pilus assembly protein PilQ
MLLLISCFLVAPFAQALAAEESGNQILSLSSNVVGERAEIRLKGVQPFVSSVYELPKPERVVVDIADAQLADSFSPPASLPFRLVTSQVPGSNPTITRFEFFVPDLVAVTSNQDGQDAVIIITAKNIGSAPAVSSAAGLPDSASAAKFSGIQVRTEKGKTVVRIGANRKITQYSKETYAKSKKEQPRLVIDLNEIEADAQLLGSQQVNTSVSRVVSAQRGSGIRVILYSAMENLFPFTLSETDSGLEIAINESGTKDQVSKIIDQQKNLESQLPEINPLDTKLSPRAREQQMQDAFDFSGYNKDRITVEFQKMDLHNVFNFLRQVSGVNIVVDESVQGSLTLVLDDVPWDFALDIILNLKGLEKEERFNTLVIYPKGKGFVWPEQAANNLSFEADSAVIEKEALVIQQQEKQSDAVVDAKGIINKARQAEQREDFETAVVLYQRALEKWPENVQLAGRISSIYLVQLRQNAKALYFAQRALIVKNNDQVALLNAGIASANMQDIVQAEKYFAQSVRAQKPLKEAFLNYAAFKEERKGYREALSMLNQHDQLYGKSLDSMIAAARINDAMGNKAQADKLYRAILTSGFQVPPDLAKFIQGRVTLKSTL